MSYKLFIHKDFEERRNELKRADPHRDKYVAFALLQLAIAGGNGIPRPKQTRNHKYSWMRTPINGFHYYLWWHAGNPNKTEDSTLRLNDQKSIFVREIRIHDKNSEPLEFGDSDDYTEYSIHQPELDPRDSEQKKVTENNFIDQNQRISLRTVRGIPGSGKTLALYYAVKQLSKYCDQILYITYTDQLKDEASKFFKAHEIDNNIKIYTLQELQGLILDQCAYYSNIQDDLEKFNNFLRQYRTLKADLRAWNNDYEMLWIEIRAYLLGMALPYSWKREGIGIIETRDKILSKDCYEKLRGEFLDKKSKEQAYFVADYLNKQNQIKNLFGEQEQALLSFESLAHKTLNEIKNTQAIVVDEVQDLTLLQIALLMEIGKKLIQNNNQKQFTFILAGDESQTLYPSGFDWGITQDLFSNQFEVEPKGFKLMEERRSLGQLETLILSTKRLYENIPKLYRPKDLNSVPLSSDANNKLFMWEMSNTWGEILHEFNNYPDLVLINFSGYDCSVINSKNLSEESQNILHRINYTIETIKGLEREIVVIIGMSNMIKTLSEQRNESDKVKILRNRRLIDQVRVAVSRSINILIVGEESSESFSLLENNLIFNDAEKVNWEQLKNKLLREYQGIDILEKISGHLSNAWQLLNSGKIISQDKLKKAKLENEEALKLLEKVEPNTERKNYEKQVQNQRRKIQEKEINQLLDKAEDLIIEEDFANLDILYSQIAKLNLSKLNPIYSDRFSNIKKSHKFYNDNKKVSQNYDKINRSEDLKGFAEDYLIFQDFVKQLLQSVKQTSILHSYIDKKQKELLKPNQKQLESKQRIESVLDAVARGLFDKATDAKKRKDWPSYSSELYLCAHILEEQNLSLQTPKLIGVQVLKLIAERYQELPPSDLSLKTIPKLINYIHNLSVGINSLQRKGSTERILVDWVLELVELLENDHDIYPKISNLIKEKIFRDRIFQNVFLHCTNHQNEVRKIQDDFIRIVQKTSDLDHLIELHLLFKREIPREVREIHSLVKNTQKLIHYKYIDLFSNENYRKLSEVAKNIIKAEFMVILEEAYSTDHESPF